MRLITGSADQSAKLWDVKTGQQLFSFKFGSPARSVDFALGDKLAVITTDPFMERTSAIHVKRIAEDPEDRKFCYFYMFVGRSFYICVKGNCVDALLQRLVSLCLSLRAQMGGRGLTELFGGP